MIVDFTFLLSVSFGYMDWCNIFKGHVAGNTLIFKQEKPWKKHEKKHEQPWKTLENSNQKHTNPLLSLRLRWPSPTTQWLEQLPKAERKAAMGRWVVRIRWRCHVCENSVWVCVCLCIYACIFVFCFLKQTF